MPKEFEVVLGAMTGHCAIARATEADTADILALQYAAYQSEAEIYQDFTIQPLTQTLEQAEEEFQDSVVLKAVMGGEIVGSVRAHERDRTVLIGKLMVLPALQNKGIGKQLLRAMEQEFPDKRFELFTGTKSIKNLELYKGCGYKEYKTESVAPGLSFVYLEKRPTCIREIATADYPKLEDFLYHAVFVPEGEEKPPREIVFDPEIYVYIKDFGQESDCGIVAECDGILVGAAWARIIPAFGHIDNDTPELAISVLPEYRGQAIGTRMMERLFELLRKRGYRRTSLSVQKNNPAVRFYRRLGYDITDEKLDHVGHEDYIMLKGLVECLDTTT